MSKTIDYSKLKETKVTLPIIGVLALMVFAWKADKLTVDYLDDFFMTKAVAEEQFESINKQLGANATLISGHIRTYELNENAKSSQLVQDQIYELQLYISANGENDLTRTRQRDLDASLSRLGRVRACIVRNADDENCNAII